MPVKIPREDIDGLVSAVFEQDLREVDLLGLTVSFLRSKGLSELEALEYSDRLLPRVLKRVKKRLDFEARIGITSKYEFHELNHNLLILTCLEKDAPGINPGELINIRKKIYEHIKTIHWKQFEEVGKIVLGLNGVIDSEVTQASNEGGIDIFGWYVFRDFGSRVLTDLKLRIVAQAKHKSQATGVGNKEISPFIVDVERLKRKKHPKTFKLPEVFFASNDPIIPIFITNGYYQYRAEIEAESHNIVIWNGEQIAEDLALGLIEDNPCVTGLIKMNE